MKKMLSLALVLSMVILCFSGCSFTIQPTEEVYTDCEGVYITIDSIDESGDHPTLKVTWHNETEDTVLFGLGYTIEYLDGEEWKNIQITDFAIPEIACILGAGESGEQSYTTKYFNMLRPGTYRIKVEYNIQADQPKSGIAYAIFEQLKQKF